MWLASLFTLYAPYIVFNVAALYIVADFATQYKARLIVFLLLLSFGHILM